MKILCHVIWTRSYTIDERCFWCSVKWISVPSDKNVRLKGFIINYNYNARLAFSVITITAWDFVKIDYTDKATDEIAEYLLDELSDLLDCFENNYVGLKNRSKSRWRPTIFSSPSWIVHDRVFNQWSRSY